MRNLIFAMLLVLIFNPTLAWHLPTIHSTVSMTSPRSIRVSMLDPLTDYAPALSLLNQCFVIKTFPNWTLKFPALLPLIFVPGQMTLIEH